MAQLHEEKLLMDPISRINYDVKALFDQQMLIKSLDNRKEVQNIMIAPYKGVLLTTRYANNSWNWMSTTNAFRKFVMRITFNVWFERFILCTILANCTLLTISDPNAEETPEQAIAELVFLIIFTMEMTLKTIALGFALEPNTYLRDPWNVLDFVVVVVGWLGTFNAAGNISAIRTIRILRPLRTINSVPEMKMLVNSIVKSIPLLMDIFALFVFVLLVFSIVGLQSYSGLFYQRCFDQYTRDVANWDDNELWYIDLMKCDDKEINCGASGCDEDEYCWKSSKNPDSGVTAFDNVLQSMLTVFTAITLEGWSQVMYWAREVSDSKYMADIYFILMVFLGAFIVINLIIAVQYDTFIESKKEEEAEVDEEEDEKDKEDVVEGDEKWRPIQPCDVMGNPIESGCSFHWYKFRHLTFTIVTNTWFSITISILILINTAILASDHYKMTEAHLKFNEISNVVLNSLFAIEMIMKLFGLTPRGYVSDKMNIFDGFLVIVGIVDIIAFQDSSSGVTVLRAFRLFRVFKLAKSWKKLAALLDIMIQSLNAVMYLGLLCMLCIFIYALLGTQFFSKKLTEDDGESPRSNFDHIGWSMLAIFQILSGENWNEIMYMAIDQVGWISALYFVSLILIGNYILFNLFLAILLSMFENKEDNELDDIELGILQEQLKETGSDSKDAKNGKYQNGQKTVEGSQASTPKACDIPEIDLEGRILSERIPIDVVASKWGISIDADQMWDSKVRNQQQRMRKSLLESGIARKTEKQEQKQKFYEDQANKKKFVVVRKSCFIFTIDNPIRSFLKSLMHHPYWEEFIYALIAASSIALAFDEPNISDYKANIMVILHNIFLGLFIIEMVVKIIVMGFYCGEKTYLKDGWNRLDFFIVLVGVVDLIIANSTSELDLRFLRALRALRALRPLRMVSRNEGLKIVVSAVLQALPDVMNVFLIMLLFYLIFGILGVIFFKGSFYQCSDPHVTDEEDCEGYFINPNSGVIVQREWRNSPYHFDNIFMAMLTLFEVSGLEMWPDYMYLAIDAVGPGKAPKRNNNPIVSIYFIFFIFFTTFFIMNLFVGVIIDNFDQIKSRHDGSYFLTPEQREWVGIQRLLMKCAPQIRYQRPKNCYRRFWFDVIQNPNFELVIMGIIGLNVFFMMLYFYEMPSDLESVIFWANIVFIIIYVIEFVLKISALYPKYYFADNWNRFDFLILVVSLIFISDDIAFINATVLRVLRIARLFRIVKTSKGLRRLFYTMITSLPALVDVGALLVLLFFVYGVAGMALFSQIKEGEHINKHANFKSFYNSVITLVRASTGESWNGIMHDCMQDEHAGDDSCSGPEEWGSFIFAVPYWVSFSIIAAAVFLNIFVAVILSNFAEIVAGEKQDIRLTEPDLRHYEEVWSVYCPYGEQWMLTKHLPDLLNSLKPPLGFKGQELTIFDMLRIVRDCHIQEDKGRVHFAHLIWALASNIHGANMENTRNVESLTMMSKQLAKKYPALNFAEKKNQFSLSQLYNPQDENLADKSIAAMIIVQHWRKRKEKRLVKEKLKEYKALRLDRESTDS